jgi:hypothetical protein
MTDHPAPQPADIAALMRDHGGAWQIEHTENLDVWSAVRRSPDGRHIRVLVARTPEELRAKLADVDEPPDLPAPGIAHPGGGWISGPSTPP